MHTYKQLQCFASIVEEGGFTLAAQKLYMTQPAISWQIKILEGDLGLKLIERSERRLVLTEAGRMFYERARTILDQYAKLAGEMEQFRNLETGSLCIGASTIPGEYMLARPLAMFARRHPQAALSMQIADSREIVRMLLAETISVGVVGMEPQEEGIESVTLRTDEIVCIAPCTHPLAGRKKIPFETVRREPILLREFGSGTRRRLEEEIAQKGLAPLEAYMELGSTRAVLSAVEAGLGISWVSRLALGAEKVCVLDIEDMHIERPLRRITLKNRTPSPLAEAFLSILEESFNEHME